MDSYEITYSYQGPCPDDTQLGGNVHISDGTSREFSVTDLQEFSNYTVTITAFNSVGNGFTIYSVATLALGAIASSYTLQYLFINLPLVSCSSKWASSVPHSHLYHSILHHHPVG